MRHKNSLTSFDRTHNSEDAIALATAEGLSSIDGDNKHTEFSEKVKDELEDGYVNHEGCKRVEQSQQNIELLSSDLLSNVYDKRSLKIGGNILYSFIRNNSEWLYQKLGVSENLDEIQANDSKCFSNPLLHTMFHIGYRPCDQLLLGIWKPDWNNLLNTLMGLTAERIWSL